MDRLRHEKDFHDQQAGVRAAARVQLAFADYEYFDHETWIRPAFAQLGDVRGLRVLDYGCGHGMAAVVLARAGAGVTAFDLSGGYASETRARAEANGVALDVVQADGQRLPFADQTFDRVWGCAVLHHLDMAWAAAELHRVLRPGGVAVFCEPWGGNALLELARRRLPYPGKHRTPDERPLVPRQTEILKEIFASVDIRGEQLLAMAHRLVPSRSLRKYLDKCDLVILDAVPALQHFCRYVILTLQKGN
jgi:SAM-dependent methyltransferase